MVDGNPNTRSVVDSMLELDTVRNDSVGQCSLLIYSEPGLDKSHATTAVD